MNKRRPKGAPTLHERLTHLFLLLWRRNEKLNDKLDRKFRKMTAATDKLLLEVQETREAITAKLARMQAQIDILLANPGDEAAVLDAANKLNDIQTELNSDAETLPAPEPDPNA